MIGYDNMKRYLIFCLIFISLFIVGCNKEDNNVRKNNSNENNININNDKKVSSMKVIINDKEYIINLEDNDSSKKLLELLPLEVNMNELNGNEKYVYLDSKLPVSEYSPKHINKGDVMLYGNNCLVIFYKSFDTSYSYTKIGHIDNLDDLGNKDVLVKFKI